MLSTIIRFLDNQDAPGAVWFFLAKPPNGSGMFCALNANPNASPYADLQKANLPPGTVGAAGLALYHELLAHKAIRAHFNNVFADTSKDPPRPIGLQVDSPQADCLPWETLRPADGDFLALDRRWPVVRLLDPSDDRLKQDYEYVPPLRIAAVLSAWGSLPDRRIRAETEWKSLEKGVLKGHPNGESSLLVLVCEDALKQKIDQAGYPNVRAEFITGQGQMSQALKNFRPQILHFFCHGHSGEKSYLRIATADNQAMDEDGGIYLLPADLRQDIDSEESAWLVVLNCCDGANAVRSGDTRNLAASLVKAGFPAVIGMREPFDANYARLFTEEFYTALVAKLNALPEGDVSAIEWAELLVGGRKRLRNDTAPQNAGPDAASSTKQWAIPALYMRTLPFRMRKLAPRQSEVERQAILGKLAELREQRNGAEKMKLSAALRQQMLAEFDQHIHAEEMKLL